MRSIKLILFFAGLFAAGPIYSYESAHLANQYVYGDSIQTAKMDEILNKATLRQELDLLNKVYFKLNTSSLFTSALLLNQQPLVELDIHQNSELRFQVSQEKELFFINRWSLEFKKYIHGPKFAMLTISISI